MQTLVYMESENNGNKCVRRFISSLKDMELICDAISERWSIEQDLHRSKDMMLDEDRFRISNPNACKTIGAINDVALAIIKMYQILTGRDSLKAAKMWFHSDVFKATQTLVAIKNSKEIVNTLKDALAKNKK